jgi:hypothetical protein
MTRLTPAGNPAGRFSAEQYATLDAVFAAAAPLTPGEVEALIEALGTLDVFCQLNGLAATELTPPELSDRFHAIASAADELLQKLGVADMPKQIRNGLEYFARQDAMKNVGGFPNHPPKIIPVPSDEEYSLTRFYEDRQLQQDIEGVFQIREWARQAEAANKLASRRTNKTSTEAARAREDLINSNMGKGPEFDICNKIFEIWDEVLRRPLKTSVRSSDRAASGPLIRFTTSCLKLLGVKSLESNAARRRAIKQRRIDEAVRNRVIDEAISGVIDKAAPVIDDATRRRVLEGRMTEDATTVTEHAIRQRARRYRARSK